MISKLLKNKILITDGAMGTYYHKICPDALPFCEQESLRDISVIESIHKEYIESGADLIRTNTFNANTSVLECDFETVKNIITASYKAAKNAVGNTNTLIACSIGPNAEESEEYIRIADVFISLGADIFLFETFDRLDNILPAISHIKNKKPEAVIITDFALNPSGMTAAFISAARLAAKCGETNEIDAYGFNCGIGPKHLENILKNIELDVSKPVFAMPNAGYPEIINGKTEYVMNPVYFADLVSGYTALGVKVIGGCCGTTPEHIKLLKKSIDGNTVYDVKLKYSQTQVQQPRSENDFHKKLDNNKFLYAVELDPPFKTDVSRIINGAKALKEADVDIVTIADSPMGRPRVDSTIISAKIKRETGMEVLPHLCCRDRNAISLRSALLGAYVEDIRNVLVVTGDPVPGEQRNRIKSVFNMQSYSLMGMIGEMNNELFTKDPIYYGGAVNFNVKNKRSEYSRLLKKHEQGAKFFLTQPVFTDDTIDFLASLPKERDFKILGGIMPLVNYKNAQFINNEMAGINIPEHYIARFTPDMPREEAQAVGKEIALETALKIKNYVDGFYFITPFNRYELIIEIIKNLKER